MLPGLFDLLYSGWNLYKKHFRYYLPFILVLLLISLGYTFFVQFFGPTQGTVMARNYEEVISFLIVMVPMGLLAYYATLAVTLAMAKKSSGSSPGISTVYKNTLNRFPSTLGAYFLALFPITVAGVILVYLFYRAMTDVTPGAGALISIGVGSALFALGFIIFMWFSFSHLAALLDKHSPLGAVKYSYSLVHRRLASVIWRLLAPAVVISLFAVVIGDIIEVIIKQAFSGSEQTILIASTLTSTLIAIGLGPWGYAITIKLYEALKKPRE